MALLATAGVTAATLAVATIAAPASADQIADKRAQAVALAQKIQTLGRQEDGLSERFDQATLALQAAQDRVNRANQQLAADQSAQTRARGALTSEAVDAYVNGGNEATTMTRDAQPLSDIDQNLVRAEYLGNLTSDQNDVADQYHLASLKTSDDRIRLESALGAAKRQQSSLAQDRRNVEASAAQLQGTLASVNGQIATLLAQAQLAQQQADARAARQRLANQQAAAQLAVAARQSAALQAAAAQQTSGLAGVRASNSSSGTASNTSGSATLAGTSGATTPAAGVPVTPVGTGSLQARAIAAAESRLGDDYVWGAAGPNTFDCSGLVMWSYAQAGFALPHFSGAQYALTIHIPLADVEPGDLVFPADPGEHVAMYIGGGNIIEAPYTGAWVHIVPLSNFFVYASRVP
jgi:cell wall-associated NlpC family hydrolase